MFIFQLPWLRSLLLSCMLLSGCFFSSRAYLPLHSSNELLTQGLTLFQRRQYESAQYRLEAYIRLCSNDFNSIEAQYYAALCAIKLDRPDGEERFYQLVKTYPQHPKTVLAYYQLGNLYFDKQNFAKSISYYLKTDGNALDQVAQYVLQYRLAYAYLNEKNFAQALVYFNNIKTFDNAYCHAASYYAGYLAFKNGDYATALNDLMRASENPAYKAVVPYLILQIYYKQKCFQELLNYLHEVSSAELFLKNEDEISLLVAEAYFFTGNYATAAKHYEEYIAHKDFVVTSEILYRTAYALYQAKGTHKALKYFKELALQEDAMGQAASYYAGILYTKANQKKLALAAFDKAQKAHFCTDIQEEAAFQYIRVCYDLGNFTSVIKKIQKFRQVHTASRRLAEINVLLAEAYFRTRDYDLAIAHIEELNPKSQHMFEIYQKVTFYKGCEYFNNTTYDQAICLFRKSLQYPFNQLFATEAQLWLGESLSGLQQYEQAILVYQQVLDSTVKTDVLHQQAVYGLGYAYLNSANYSQAISQFIQYTRQHQNKTSTVWFQDALVRLADCYYATKEYRLALQHYNQVIRSYPAHVHYQKGVIYRILDDQEAARRNFQVIFDDYVHTPYYEKALFEAANIALVQNNYPQAIEGFTKLIHERPHSTLLPDSVLSRAVAHVNLEQYSLAIEDYERLLQSYPKHPSAQSALLELTRICILEGKPESSKQYLTQYQAANVDTKALEKITFDTAKALFYDQAYPAAVEQLQRFIACYPKSKLVPEALFLVAETYYRQSDVSSALARYQEALRVSHTPFYNKILLRIGILAYRQKDFSQAFVSYQQLRDRAQNSKERHHALVGMMKTSYALRRYEEAQQYAVLIVEQENIVTNAASEALLFLGKAAMQQGKRQEAQAYFTQIVQNVQDKHAAEAQYLLGQLHYVAEAYQQSLQALFKVNTQFPSYKEWTDKSFLLIAQNYLALEEDLQAKATLQSIIENADEETIVASAQQMLEALVKKLAPPVESTGTVVSPSENRTNP